MSSKLVNDGLKIGIIAIVSLIPVAVLKAFGFHPVITLVAGCSCLPLYYAVVCYNDEELKKMILDYWPNTKFLERK